MAYGELAPSDHQHFFRLLSEEHSVDHNKVVAAAAELAGTQVRSDAALLLATDGSTGPGGRGDR